MKNKDLFIIDGHNDLPWQVRKTGDFDFKDHDLTKPQPDFHTDIPRLIEGGVGAQFWSAYVSPATVQTKTAVRDTLEQIALIHTMIDKFSDHFGLALTSDEITKVYNEGKIASLIGVEGGYSIGNSIGALRAFYQLGVRYMTLTHNDNTDWADSATDEKKHGGMTEFGVEVVQEMNRLGMMVDIAHVSWDTMRDVLECSKAPVLSTHSGACGVAETPRNIPDDLLKPISDKGGMVMVCFASSMVHPGAAKSSIKFYKKMREAKEQFLNIPNPSEQAFREHMLAWIKDNPVERGTISDLADHVDHMVKVMGIEHVGIGSDFGGCSTLPVDMEDVSKYPNLTKELLARDYSEEDIKKIYNKNILRVMKDVENVARSYNKS